MIWNYVSKAGLIVSLALLLLCAWAWAGCAAESAALGYGILGVGAVAVLGCYAAWRWWRHRHRRRAIDILVEVGSRPSVPLSEMGAVLADAVERRRGLLLRPRRVDHRDRPLRGGEVMMHTPESIAAAIEAAKAQAKPVRAHTWARALTDALKEDADSRPEVVHKLGHQAILAGVAALRTIGVHVRSIRCVDDGSGDVTLEFDDVTLEFDEEVQP